MKNFNEGTLSLKPLVVAITALLLCQLPACGGGGGGGGGTTIAPPPPPPEDMDNDGVEDSVDVDFDGDGLIEIQSLAALDVIRLDLSGTSLGGNSQGCPTGAGCNGYELVNDLDFDTNSNGLIDGDDTYTDYDDDGFSDGWLPIGTASSPFAAIFEGNGFAISNLYIDRDATDSETSGTNIGLFGAVGQGGAETEIRNLVLDGPLMSITGVSNVGALVGKLGGDTGDVSVDAIAVQGGALLAGNNSVGGIAGRAVTSLGSTLVLRNVSADVQLEVELRYGGGLIGYLHGAGGVMEISDSVALGSLTVQSALAEAGHAGGAVGRILVDNASSVVRLKKLEAGLAVDAPNGSAVGGLLGSVSGAVGEVNAVGLVARGDVTGLHRVGGLLGNGELRTAIGLDLTGVLAAGAVSGSGNYVGGLVGLMYDTVVRAGMAIGDVSGNSFVGGLIGNANEGSDTRYSYASGTANGNSAVGALVGYRDRNGLSHNHYLMDGTGNNAVGNSASTADEVIGFDLATLQCPTVANNTSCHVQTLYTNWHQPKNSEDDNLWDFGSATELPGLLIGGVVYRDADGDGVLD